ncbi:MAG: hypothetical protein H6679_00535 [Epsilonproteobacteria bacterium]|nr:hypothetical protein [Campylobacterota bacterium]
MNQEYGFTLKQNFSNRKKYNILTLSKGKIHLYYNNNYRPQEIRPNTLVSFHFQKNALLPYATDNFEIIATPITATTHDLYWIHHLAELCYYFLPLEYPNHEVFKLVFNSYTLLGYRHKIPQFERLKKITALTFLVLIDHIPLNKLDKPSCRLSFLITGELFINVIKEDTLKTLCNALDALDENQMTHYQAVIIECLKEHPRFDAFNTVRFMYD